MEAGGESRRRTGDPTARGTALLRHARAGGQALLELKAAGRLARAEDGRPTRKPDARPAFTYKALGFDNHHRPARWMDLASVPDEAYERYWAAGPALLHLLRPRGPLRPPLTRGPDLSAGGRGRLPERRFGRLGPRLLTPPPLEFQVSDPEVSRQRLTDAGPTDVRVERTAERPAFASGQEMWDWMLYSNPISGMVVADLSDDQRARLRQVLDGMLRERAGANGRAALTNAVNIGVGTK